MFLFSFSLAASNNAPKCTCGIDQTIESHSHAQNRPNSIPIEMCKNSFSSFFATIERILCAFLLLLMLIFFLLQFIYWQYLPFYWSKWILFHKTLRIYRIKSNQTDKRLCGLAPVSECHNNLGFRLSITFQPDMASKLPYKNRWTLGP